MKHLMTMPENPFDIAAVLANCQQYWLNFSQTGPSDGSFAVYRTGVPHPQLNGVIRMKEPARDAIPAVVSQLEQIASLWWIGPDSYAGASEDVIDAGGKLVAKVPVMATQLSDIHLKMEKSAAFTIESLEEGEDLTSWVASYCEPMGVAARDFDAMLSAERGRTDAPGQLVRFAARIGEKIVGTSQLFVHEGIAGIYLVSTHKDHRRLGIGTALTYAACVAGLERGLEIATLQASSSGYPIYKNLGFKDVTAYNLLTFSRD